LAAALAFLRVTRASPTLKSLAAKSLAVHGTSR
jgi:hypothetical protein